VEVAPTAALALVVFLLATVTACAREGDAARRTATTVSRVVDGDTLVVSGGERVRLLQIDAPEAGRECHASASRRFLAALSPPGTRVLLEPDARLDRVDRFGRLLRYVHAADVNVNVELVRRGAATPWFYRGERGRYAAQLLASVREARVARRGLWGACGVSWTPNAPIETRHR